MQCKYNGLIFEEQTGLFHPPDEIVCLCLGSLDSTLRNVGFFMELITFLFHAEIRTRTKIRRKTQSTDSVFWWPGLVRMKMWAQRKRHQVKPLSKSFWRTIYRHWHLAPWTYWLNKKCCLICDLQHSTWGRFEMEWFLWRSAGTSRWDNVHVNAKQWRSTRSWLCAEILMGTEGSAWNSITRDVPGSLTFQTSPRIARCRFKIFFLFISLNKQV